MIAEEIKHSCTKCGSKNITRNGKTTSGKQKYKCKECGGYGTLNPQKGYSEEVKQQVIDAYFERSSLRGLERVFKISRITITEWLKKSVRITKLKRNLVSSSSR